MMKNLQRLGKIRFRHKYQIHILNLEFVGVAASRGFVLKENVVNNKFI
jgi:hypothetical protein